MKSSKLCGLLLAGAVVTLAGCNKAGTADNHDAAAANSNAAVATSPSDPVKSAESAAPASVAHLASVVTLDADGAMKTVRQGSNGWTCMPDSPATPGPDPMCFDTNAAKWVEA